MIKPFLKWAGGKRSILPLLLDRVPKTYRAYYEPFLGGGALFFALNPPSAFLSDINPRLITTYAVVKERIEELIRQLKEHASLHNKDYYYQMRRLFSSEQTAVQTAALFIYLNRTGFNGLYRVNKKGEFNVPIGDYEMPTILDEPLLRAISERLKRAEIKQCSFDEVEIVSDGFYYFDPPYYNTFDGYDGNRFLAKDHERLANFCRRLDKAGSYFMVSNSDDDFVRKIYDGFFIEEIMASKSISCKGEGRGKKSELIIRNFIFHPPGGAKRISSPLGEIIS